MEPDINQEIYGLPEYLSALKSAWLNESATLFRYRYYQNGSHAGFILYMNVLAQSQEDIDKLREALKARKDQETLEIYLCTRRVGKKMVCN